MLTTGLKKSVADLALQTLTAKGRLAADAVSVHTTPLLQDAKPCGLHFAIRGPRDVLLTAIWDAGSGILLCYDSRGERFDAIPVESN